jgi:ATP-binding cassette, subfamily B, bacterial MsbA
MSSTDRSAKHDRARNLAAFWRAARSLLPYRRMVAISIFCALFVGVAFAGGITTMLPIMRVLLNGDTLAGWAERQVAAERLDVRFNDDAARLLIVGVGHKGPGAAAGLRAGMEIKLPDAPSTVAAPTLAHVADPSVNQVTLQYEAGTTAGSVTVQLPALKPTHAVLRNITQKAPRTPVAAVACVFGVIGLIVTVGGVIRFFQEYLSDKAAIMAVNDLRRRLFDHIVHLPMAHFGSRGSSDVTSRLVQDANGLQDGLKTFFGAIVQETIKIVAAFSVAMFFSWKLTLFIILFAPAAFAIIKKFGKKMRRSARKALQSSSSMLGQIEATMTGIRVVKGSNAERFERRRYAGIMSGLMREQLKMSRIDAMSGPTMEALNFLLIGVIVLMATWMVMERHSLDREDFLIVMVCLGGIGDSIRKVSKINNVLEKSNAAATRIFEVLDMPVERLRQLRNASKRPRIKLPPVQKEVVFEDITFTYPGAVGPALVNVDLRVPKGRSVAIVGRNGSGKTTLLALLPRFYDPDSGRVTIDGIDVREATLKSLREQISVVTQDSVIFPGTIAENIAYGHPAASRLRGGNDAGVRELRAWIEDAAKRAFAHDFILEKPKGYDTMLDGLGGGLSGGQRQRLNIARAILKKSPILILDEATSQVDAESEHLIQQAIESLMHERTTFVIAHRFSTILSADQIVVMDRGQIVGMGKHEELMKSCPTYVHLYQRQLPPDAA